MFYFAYIDQSYRSELRSSARIKCTYQSRVKHHSNSQQTRILTRSDEFKFLSSMKRIRISSSFSSRLDFLRHGFKAITLFFCLCSMILHWYVDLKVLPRSEDNIEKTSFILQKLSRNTSPARCSPVNIACQADEPEHLLSQNGYPSVQRQ